MARRNTILVNKTLYQVGVITMIAAVLWLGIGIYLALTKSTTSDVDPVLLEPLNPSIDQNVVKALSERLKVEEIFMAEQDATISATQESTTSATENVTINEDKTR